MQVPDMQAIQGRGCGGTGKRSLSGSHACVNTNKIQHTPNYTVRPMGECEASSDSFFT